MYLEQPDMYLDDNLMAHHRRNDYLILMRCDGKPSLPIKCLVRKLAQRQRGMQMVGYIRFGRDRINLINCYGRDGNPVPVPERIYNKGLELSGPAMSAFINGARDNFGVGTEESSMRLWAQENIGHLVAPTDKRRIK